MILRVSIQHVSSPVTDVTDVDPVEGRPKRAVPHTRVWMMRSTGASAGVGIAVYSNN